MASTTSANFKVNGDLTIWFKIDYYTQGYELRQRGPGGPGEDHCAS
jgi:hypothetical protein